MATDTKTRSLDEILSHIVSTISPDEEKKYETHLDLRTATKRLEMRYEKFMSEEGGTEKIFDEVYHNVYKLGKEKKIKEKDDIKSVATGIELVVTEALKSAGTSAKIAAEIFQASAKAGEFKEESEKIGYLMNLASQYLHVDQKQFKALQSGMESGNAAEWDASVREFTNSLKESLIDKYIMDHLTDITKGEGGQKLAAYTIKNHFAEKYRVEPEKLGKAMLGGYQDALARADALHQSRDPRLYKKLGLKDIGPIGNN